MNAAASQPLDAWVQFSATTPTPRASWQCVSLVACLAFMPSLLFFTPSSCVLRGRYSEPIAKPPAGSIVAAHERFTIGAAKVYVGWVAGTVPENPASLSSVCWCCVHHGPRWGCSH